MIKIGLLSDTHGYLDEKIFEHFKECDEIWHAGDIGTLKLAKDLSNFKNFRAVSGNIDGTDIKMTYPETLRFFCEEVDVLIKHIGGYPGKYDRYIKKKIIENPPKLFISGHSHILKVMYDKKFKLLHINPGAAGKSGMHSVLTIVRFVIDRTEIKDLEALQLGNQ